MKETVSGEQTQGRLVVLLALPGASMFFSLFSLLLPGFGGTIDMARAIFIMMAAVAGFGGLITGGIVLIVQLSKNNLHVQNALYFMLAWIASVVVFSVAIMGSF